MSLWGGQENHEHVVGPPPRGREREKEIFADITQADESQ